jgi:hypothetical protein
MRILSVCYLSLTILAAGAGATAARDAAAPPTDKAYVTDGSVVHDVGRLLLNITNFGLLGSQYTVPSPFSQAPSGRWPGSNGVDHLWSAGLWIGAEVLGERHVSTGQYETELRATEAPADTIYRLAWGAPGAARYPLPSPDDDADGVEDEDPCNGRDDDGDGLTDEDAAGVGDQHFRCELDDLHAGDDLIDHVPLGIAVVQQSYQWSHDAVADIVGFDFTIKNVGDQVLEDIYVGMFSDFDIDDPQGGPVEAADDLYGHFTGVVPNELGQDVPVSVGYMYEGAGATVSGYMGWVVLDHPVDPQGEVAPVAVGMRTFQRFSGSGYEQGGDPTNDNERYEVLSEAADDPDPEYPDDYRIVVSTGPFAALGLDQEMTVSLALVAGADLDAMLENAADAVTLFRGLALDRDGNPENGAEFQVRWLGPVEIEVSNEDLPDDGEVPPPPSSLALAAAPNPFNPALEVRVAMPGADDARVTIVDLRGREVRVLHDGALAAGESRWVWDGRDDTGLAAASGVYLVHLDTPQRVMRKAVTLVR